MVPPQLAAAAVLAAQAVWGGGVGLGGGPRARPAERSGTGAGVDRCAVRGGMGGRGTGRAAGGGAARLRRRHVGGRGRRVGGGGVTIAAAIAVTHGVIAWAAWVFLTPGRPAEVEPPAGEAVARRRRSSGGFGWRDWGRAGRRSSGQCFG